MTPGAPMSRFAMCSAMTANGAISPSASSPISCRRRELPDWLDGRRLEAIIHLGAISETTATDGDLVIETNFRLSMRLLDWCTDNATPFIYASSASTYGDGAQGFRDDPLDVRAKDTAADEFVRLEQASVRHGGRRAREPTAKSCRRNGPA